MSCAFEETEVAILDRVFQPSASGWSSEVANEILNLRFDDSDCERLSALLEKAKAGDLPQGEAVALENYRHVGRLLELMKSKARRSLAHGRKV